MSAHKEYRQKWVDAGYKSDMGSAVACTPPSDKDHLRVYHLTTAEYAISNLALGRLKVARFSEMNDPFELHAFDDSNPRMRRIIRQFKDSYNSHTGLLCFSGDWTEPVMWSHYAMKHRGICLGFNVPKTSLKKVVYEDQRIVSDLIKTEASDDLDADIERLLLTKSIGWEYENEYRKFVTLENTLSEGNLNFVRFGQELELAEVILGPLCEHSIENLRRLAETWNPASITFKSRLAFKFFKIVPDERTIP